MASQPAGRGRAGGRKKQETKIINLARLIAWGGRAGDEEKRGRREGEANENELNDADATKPSDQRIDRT